MTPSDDLEFLDADPHYLLTHWVRRHGPPSKGLTLRQRQVAVGLWAGLKRREIAAALGISATVVSMTRRALFTRLGVASTAELLAHFESTRLSA